MPRPLRVEYPGAIYHVMNRGNQRAAIFKADKDRRRFLDTLGETCAKTGWQVHAWCLMRNHFHLVIETPAPNLVAGMKWFLGVYTIRFNIRHKTCGHLFAGRYKALIVEGGGNGYLQTVCDYVHLNPVRAKSISSSAPLESFSWSSYRYYLKESKARPAWLRVDRLFGEQRISKDTPAGRGQFSLQMQTRSAREQEANYEEVRQAWCVGSEAFRKKLLASTQGRAGANHYARERQAAGEHRAERIVREGLKELGWRERELDRRLKGDPGKVKLASRLRQETTMTLAWIAARLRMGTWTYVSNLLKSLNTTKKLYK